MKIGSLEEYWVKSLQDWRSNYAIQLIVGAFSFISKAVCAGLTFRVLSTPARTEDTVRHVVNSISKLTPKSTLISIQEFDNYSVLYNAYLNIK